MVEAGSAVVPEVDRSVWLLVGEKLGDNAQVRVIADALPWPCEERKVFMQEQWAVGKPRVRPSLHHVDRSRSDALEPPWPDLVIAIGRRLSMVALWIHKQSAGRTRIVLVGKPRRLDRRFDLIVAAAHYRVRERDNVLRLDLPLMRVDEAAVAAGAERWRSRLEALPRPLTALLVGGPTKPVVFDATVARDLIGKAAHATRDGGTLYVTTSRRTPPDVVEALAAGLPQGGELYRWQPGAEDNPYFGLLGLADRFVATSDSVTMMVEVARLGKPLAVFELPPAHGRWRARLGSRDLSAVPDLLVERGLAVRLGEPFRPPDGPPPDDLRRVVERIRRVLDS